MAYLQPIPILLYSSHILFCLFSLLFKWDSAGFPWNWPILGMIPTVIRHIHRIHDRLTEVLQISASSTFYFKGIWFTNTSFLITVDPSNIHHITFSNFQNYSKGLEFNYISEVLGDGVFNADDDSWKNQHKTAQHLLSLEKYVEIIMTRATREKLEKGLVPILEHFVENKNVVDLRDLFLRFMFDVTCMVLVGFDFNSLCLEFPQIPFAKAMEHDVQPVLFYRHLYPKFYWELLKTLGIGDAKRLKNGSDTIKEVLAKLIAKKRQCLNLKQQDDDDDRGGGDLITRYMENEDDEIYYDDKFFKDTSLTYLLAGRDGIGVTLSWFFYVLSKNPIIIGKIREELNGIMITKFPQKELEHSKRQQQPPQIFGNEELSNLAYLHGALSETLRLYPPVAFEHKMSVDVDTLPSGHHVKPGTRIFISMYALGRMKRVWGHDYEEFKPERWISEKGTIRKEPSYEFFTFNNAGPSSCLGKEVSFSLLKMISATIIHNYDIEAVVEDDTDIQPVSCSIILYMNSGFKVKVSKRF